MFHLIMLIMSLSFNYIDIGCGFFFQINNLNDYRRLLVFARTLTTGSLKFDFRSRQANTYYCRGEFVHVFVIILVKVV